MNIIEAIKSGKRFRRPSMQPHAWYQQHGNSIQYMNDSYMDYGISDIPLFLADDWEIEKSKCAFIPRSLILKAYEELKDGRAQYWCCPASDIEIKEI